jgi:tungstate transport system ATP-binding protein
MDVYTQVKQCGGENIMSSESIDLREKAARSAGAKQEKPEHAFTLQQTVVQKKDKTILDIDALALPAGRITAIVGPSGAGKTTFMKVLNLLLVPDNGHLTFFGQKLYGSPFSKRKRLDIQRQMALVSQKPVMFHSSVFDNVAQGVRYRKIGRGKIREKVKRALQLVRMENMEKLHAPSLSGGEQQRVALARSIVTEPKALLLDEATANLDPGHVKIMESVVHRLNLEQNMTVVMITHHLQQAERLADICLFMYAGKVLEVAERNNFFKQPRHKFTQAFLSGDMIY